LPNFDGGNKTLVDNLINSNRNKLLNTPYLIIDIRSNGGGADGTFSSILPFLYTNPFEVIGNDILSSKINIAGFEKILDKVDNNKEWIRSIIERMKENPGKFVTFVGGNTVNSNSVTPNPRKIGLKKL
jgi:hypothetical protein